ncbi:23S rRNA (adenine(2030)-N(6))-methyltransferase RlmJ [Pseudomarimonas salicorniae]|uniref:Ribosomal RNA large subunit methyltransferase J n=1 Tax=Pseudomarimonas salicorniae TaxID=2933270 RepID=A0ABT0GJN2_9GAMM|nr:23S rRNA (adenine(2030)-N(6))-methyltransferase RlmJ [Lysobacter sp. CAU 1642]MCK7594738.1 23S rRNA (adenine(2030)-N(6))-methyltransferase RlmJ [Lysobacter sp. CAU 1642]
MNYRHGFHAGNHADVLKHSLLLALIERLQEKPGGVFLLDTHAGRGHYSLKGDEAQRTGEWRTGIGRLVGGSVPAPLQGYVERCTELAGEAGYPGSPLLMASCLREQDRMAVCELQEGEFAALRALLGAHARVAVHHRDGYEAAPALSPPAERRGLILIDPPYELQRDEFALIERCIATVLARWTQAVIALWYPIKQRVALRAPFRRLSRLNARQLLALELLVQADDTPLRLNGSGMLVFNPPWRFAERAAEILDALAPRLCEAGGGTDSTWLKQEAP